MLQPFHFWCQKVLPLVYDESLSYYEVLCKLSEYIEDVIKRLDTLENDLPNTINSIIDSKLESFKKEFATMFEQEIANIRKEFTDLQAKIEQELKEYEDATTEKIQKMLNEIKTFEDKINSEIIAINLNISKIIEDFSNYKKNMDKIFEINMQELKKYIDEHITEITRLYVKDPYDGQIKDVQIVLNEIVKRQNYGYGLTATEYDNLQLTALQYDTKQLTAREYDYRGVLVFFKDIYNRMRSPFTGKMEYYDNIIYDLCNFHRNSYNCMEYDNKLITAETYDSYLVTAYTFDWNSKTVLI